MYRLMQPSDEAAVLALWQSQHHDTEDFAKMVLERFAGMQNIYVADENDAIVAAALAVPVTLQGRTGNSVPSLKTLIDIINALDCSADELLCIEIKKAKPVFDGWMTEQLADCSADEAKIIKETVVSLKKSLRKVYGKSSKYRYD